MPQVEQFHRELARRLAPTGRLQLLMLKADGQIIGADYAYQFGSRLHGIFRGYRDDETWRRHGLGTLLNCMTIEKAIRQGTRILDSGAGLFEHKLRLGGQLHGTRSLVVVRSGRGTRLRFWAALRIAYLMHVFYSRIWVDMIAPCLGIIPGGCHRHQRYGVLAQIHRRARFRLLGGSKVMEARLADIHALPPGVLCQEDAPSCAGALRESGEDA